MKCRACWTDKAYLREERGFKAAVFSCLGLVPFKCHHCFHKFYVLWFQTWGKSLHPPVVRPASQATAVRSPKPVQPKVA